MGNMGDNVKEPTAQSMMLSLLTIVIILLVQKFTKGFVKSISILIGLVAGTLVSAMMGLVDTTPVVRLLGFMCQPHFILACQLLKSLLL